MWDPECSCVELDNGDVVIDAACPFHGVEGVEADQLEAEYDLLNDELEIEGDL